MYNSSWQTKKGQCQLKTFSVAFSNENNVFSSVWFLQGNYFEDDWLMDLLIDSNGISTHLGLFYD